MKKPAKHQRAYYFWLQGIVAPEITLRERKPRR